MNKFKKAISTLMVGCMAISAISAGASATNFSVQYSCTMLLVYDQIWGEYNSVYRECRDWGCNIVFDDRFLVFHHGKTAAILAAFTPVHQAKKKVEHTVLLNTQKRAAH